MKKLWPFFRTKSAEAIEVATSSTPMDLSEDDDIWKKSKFGGWKCMPYIIGNETFEKVASTGLTANFSLYLVGHFNMKKVDAAQFTNIFGGTINFAPLLGAFISDAYLGRFRTLSYTSVASFLGMIVLTLTSTVPQLQPVSCTPEAIAANDCPGATKCQLGILILALLLLTIGAAGIRPCSLPFGVDQFDRRTEEGRRGLNSYFNWYYCTSTAATVLALTIVVYIQSSISWAIGFALPAGLMLVALVMFFLGTRLYEYVPPEGSVFSGIAEVFVAAFHKRTLLLPAADDVEEQEEVLYNAFTRSERVMKLPLSLQFRFLNKAAIICKGDLNDDGSIAKPWRICNIQQIEEVKCLLRIVPIWGSGIVCFVALAQQWTYAVYQSLTMDRSLGPHFQIPPATIGAIALIALTIFIPIYDQLLTPIARKITGLTSGITLLQRQGTGLVISALSMVVAGLVEQKRRNSALAHKGGLTPMSAMWLSPQLILMGIAEAFNAVGQIEFYNRQFPEHMQTLAGSLFFCSLAGSNYLSAVLVSIIKKKTGWLNENVNLGRVDNFYYVIAGMGVINFMYFLVCAHFYRYKGVCNNVNEVIIEKTRDDSSEIQRS